MLREKHETWRSCRNITSGDLVKRCCLSQGSLLCKPVMLTVSSSTLPLRACEIWLRLLLERTWGILIQGVQPQGKGYLGMTIKVCSCVKIPLDKIEAGSGWIRVIKPKNKTRSHKKQYSKRFEVLHEASPVSGRVPWRHELRMHCVSSKQRR